MKYVPPGWPIRREGLFIGYLGPVLVFILGKNLDQPSWDLFVNANEDSVSRLEPTDRICGFYQMTTAPWWGALSLLQRAHEMRRLAHTGLKYSNNMRSSISATVFFPHNALVRASVRASTAIVRMPSPFATVSDVPSAWRFLRRNPPLRGEDWDAIEKQYAAIIAADFPELKEI